jgi:biotin carboxylase
VLVIGGLDYTIERFPALDVDFVLFQEREKLTTTQQAMAAGVEVMALADHEPLVAKAIAHHLARPFQAVFSFTEFGLHPASLVADALGIPSNCNLVTNLCSRDKLRMRDRLRAAGIDHVPYRQVSTVEEIAEFFAGQAGRPVVLKPSMGAGSLGVCAITSADEIGPAFEHASRAEHGPLMVEAWIDGDEYSVESLSQQGHHEIIAVTEKVTTGRPHFIELGHCQPARLGPELRRRAVALVVSVLDLLEQRTGPCHTEIKIHEETPYLIETQARQGGDKISVLCELTTGARLVDETISMVLGRTRGARAASHAAAAVAFVTSPPGKVRQVSIPEGLAAATWVHDLKVEVKPGDEVRPLRSSLDRLGHVITTADCPATSLVRAFEALRDIRIVTEQPGAARTE